MWHTPSGVRTLVGAEAELIRATVDEMIDQIREEMDGLGDDWPCGVELFDGLSWPQRLALLSLVTNALLQSEIPKPKLTAVNEATIGAIFANLKRNMIMELDDIDANSDDSEFDPYYWRRRIAACQELPPSEEDRLVPITCGDEETWDTLLEILKEEILWDDDWVMPELFLDVPTEVRDKRHEKMRIEKDYYTALPPDPSDHEIPQLYKGLIQLVRR